MQKSFETLGPASVYVELGAGALVVHADDVTKTTVEVTGRHSEDVVVELRGSQIVVLAPARNVGFFGTTSEVHVDLVLPVGSELVTKAGSADVVTIGQLGSLRCRSGSGDVRIAETTGEAVVETGSGDVVIGRAHRELRIKTGSGDVSVDHATGAAQISTGSGDVELGVVDREVQVKSGSGDVRLSEAKTDASVMTASGDLRIGQFRRGALLVKNVSGDIHVGIPAGIPVWTDVSCVSGSVHSTLEGAGQPEEGQDSIELRARTISGDITLEQL